jgi:hypothetical protein
VRNEVAARSQQKQAANNAFERDQAKDDGALRAFLGDRARY